MITLSPFLRSPAQCDLVARIWNAAAGEKLAFQPYFVEYNTRPTPGMVQEGRIARINGEPVGVVFCTVGVEGLFQGQSWVDLIVVDPRFQHQGVGSQLLVWAEEFAVQNKTKVLRIAGSVRPFAAGVPLELGSVGFFAKFGFNVEQNHFDWDVARDLGGYESPDSVREHHADVRPLQAGEEGELLTFMRREFAGRWQFEVQQFFHEGGRAADFMVLRTEIGVDGFCWMTLADSARPLDRFYMNGLERPWGQIGPLGVGKGCRGKGYGGVMIDAAIRHLQARGIHGSVIDWTSLLDLYGKFGYKPFRQYQILRKELRQA